MRDIQTEPMHVTRVQDENGSHIEPALEKDWSPLQKLRWHAAVVSLDTGLNIKVHEFPTNYALNIGRSSMGINEYNDAWNRLSGISDGAQEYAREMGPTLAARAKAEALREAAEVLEQLDRAGFGGTESGDYSDIRAVASGGTVGWLRARANQQELLANAMADPEGRRLADAVVALATPGIGNWSKAKAWDEGVATALNHAILNEDGITLRLEHLDGRPWANPYSAAIIDEQPCCAADGDTCSTCPS